MTDNQTDKVRELEVRIAKLEALFEAKCFDEEIERKAHEATIWHRDKLEAENESLTCRNVSLKRDNARWQQVNETLRNEKQALINSRYKARQWAIHYRTLASQWQVWWTLESMFQVMPDPPPLIKVVDDE